MFDHLNHLQGLITQGEKDDEQNFGDKIPTNIEERDKMRWYKDKHTLKLMVCYDRKFLQFG